MNRKILLICLLFIPIYMIAQSRCSKCGGSGKMVVLSDKMASYGVKNKYRQCPICKGFFIGEHSHDCDRCNGTGHVTSAMDRRNKEREEKIEENIAEGLKYLNPQELALYYSLGDALKGHKEPVDCQPCKKTGKCILCKGARYISGMPCPGCSSTGMCTTCYGTGISSYRYVEPTQEDIDRVNRKRIELILNAYRRETGSTGGLTLVNPSDGTYQEEETLSYYNNNMGEVTIAVGQNAQIYVDGYYIADGNWSGKMTYGQHQVECKKPEYTTTKKTINVQKGKKNNFTVDTPQPTTAMTHLAVNSDAGIYVDGSFMGNGNWNGTLSFGVHKVECKKARHRTTEREISVLRNSDNIFALTPPPPIYGTLVVNTDPAGAEVVCDGKTLGYTPLTDEKVLIGSHRITVKKRYFKDEDADIDIVEAQTLKKDFTLESRLPVEITTTPANVNMKINGERYFTPISTFFKSGTYQVEIPRQYTSRGIQAKRTTLVLDSLNLTHNIRVKSDNNYDLATFFGVDYDMALQAVGVNFGSNVGKHFMFELNFFWGLQKTETIHWLNMQKNASGNISLQSYDYSHWAVDLRMGPTFWCGPFLRISPEVGAQYLKLRENGVDGTSSGMVKGGYFSAIGSMRFRLSLSQHIGLHVTPEYKFNVCNKKVLPELVDDVDKWVNGFGVKAGLVFFFH